MSFRNIKVFNRFDMGENDGIDVMESTNVRVTHAIGVGLDDPFSTKTWVADTDILRNIERLTFSNDGNRTWLALWAGNAQGAGPIEGVSISRVRVRDAGITPVRVNGQPGALITGVRISSVVMPGSSTPAGTLAQLRITNVSNAGPVTVTA